jgi:flagellar motor switch protein FliN/FliY
MEEKNGIEIPQENANDAEGTPVEDSASEDEGIPQVDQSAEQNYEEFDIPEMADKSEGSPDVEPVADRVGEEPAGNMLTGEDAQSDDAEEPEREVEENFISQEDIDQALGDVPLEAAMADRSAEEYSGPAVKQADFQQLSASEDEGGPRNIELLMDVELPVSIELGRTRMKIADILGLGSGSVVELDKLVGEPVDLLVNQKIVARGEVVVVEENFGLRVTHLVSPEERLKNLQ